MWNERLVHEFRAGYIVLILPGNIMKALMFFLPFKLPQPGFKFPL